MTIEQQQHLLAYLGYYQAEADGIRGPETERAIRAFQTDFGGLEVDGLAGPQTQKALKQAIAYGNLKRGQKADFWKEIRYFSREEFACKCGKYCDGYPVEMADTVVQAAEQVRTHFHTPVMVSSGIRCQKHNQAVGGVHNSRHLQGKAVDFAVQGNTAQTVLAFLQTLPQLRYAYAIDDNFVHMDIL